jgi:hypothetical protein
MVHAYSVFVLRVRWASTTYDPLIRPYPYFAIPEEHLVEFPGYVYHCHILPHEDNEMMRPIMLQIPSDIPAYPTAPCNTGPEAYDWNQKYKCINNRCTPKRAD